MGSIISHSWGTEHWIEDCGFKHSLPCLDHGKRGKPKIRWPGGTTSYWPQSTPTSSHCILEGLPRFLLCPCLPSLLSQHTHLNTAEWVTFIKVFKQGSLSSHSLYWQKPSTRPSPCQPRATVSSGFIQSLMQIWARPGVASSSRHRDCSSVVWTSSKILWHLVTGGTLPRSGFHCTNTHTEDTFCHFLREGLMYLRLASDWLCS